MSDLSLRQMREQLTTTPNSSSSQRLTRSSSSNSGNRSSRSGSLVPQQLFSNSLSARDSSSSNGAAATNIAPPAGPLTSGLVTRPSTSQSLLMRYAPATNNTSPGGAGGLSNSYSVSSAAAAGLNIYRSTRSALQSKEQRPAGMSHSNSVSSQSSASREAALGALLNGSIASLRATLHTDKVSSRPKVQPAGVVSQSSDFIEAGWRTPISSGSLSSSTSRPGTGVARVLAPNGQPRKVPVAALAAMMPPPAAAVSGKLQTPGTPQQLSGNVGRLSAYYSTN
jgi:hypothetical protein